MIPKMFSQLNKKTWFITTLAVFAFIWLTDFIIHTKILSGIYQETASLWRPEEDYKNHFAWLIWGQVWLAAFFTTIFGMGYEGKGWKEGVRYGLLVGLLLTAPNFISYAVMPMPQNLMFSWIFWGVLQCVGAGVVAWWIWSKAQTWTWTQPKTA